MVSPPTTFLPSALPSVCARVSIKEDTNLLIYPTPSLGEFLANEYEFRIRVSFLPDCGHVPT